MGPPRLPSTGLVESFDGAGAASSAGSVTVAGFDLDGWSISGYAKMAFVPGVGLRIQSPPIPHNRYTPRASEGTLTQFSRRLAAVVGENASQLHLELQGLQPGVSIAVRILEGESASWW